MVCLLSHHTLIVAPPGGTRVLQFWLPPGGSLPSIPVPLLPGFMIIGATKEMQPFSLKHIQLEIFKRE